MDIKRIVWKGLDSRPMTWPAAVGRTRSIAELAIVVAVAATVVAGGAVPAAAVSPVREEPPATVFEPADSHDPDPPIGSIPTP